MHIEDKCRIIEKMIKLAKEENGREHGVLAEASVLQEENRISYVLIDDCMIEEVGGKEQETCVRIPAKLSYVLIQNCKKTGNIPVIIHTHIKSNHGKKENVSFSLPDMRFMEQFSLYAAKTGGIPECLFIVTDGESIAYCLWDLVNMSYVAEGEGLSANDERKQVYCCL